MGAACSEPVVPAAGPAGELGPNPSSPAEHLAVAIAEANTGLPADAQPVPAPPAAVLEAPDKWTDTREQIEKQLELMEQVISGMQTQLADERTRAEQRAWSLKLQEPAPEATDPATRDEELASSLEYCQRLNTRVWQWEDR